MYAMVAHLISIILSLFFVLCKHILFHSTLLLLGHSYSAIIHTHVDTPPSTPFILSILETIYAIHIPITPANDITILITPIFSTLLASCFIYFLSYHILYFSKLLHHCIYHHQCHCQSYLYCILAFTYGLIVCIIHSYAACDLFSL
ncbi:hypothetical protein HK407_10g16160 [Ordospora pajunii]|uniref:uncharacterized protein n=1 Tax=Ordospora pajunii TaxID=3039483 RepID=UPI0029527CB0|nr:uncharacterized protein HK407_10g16160 [Ordospora pajunii]KAH9410850.1 hypothetical protein HK407_10g16160 [Ordospora pajunii]